MLVDIYVFPQKIGKKYFQRSSRYGGQGTDFHRRVTMVFLQKSLTQSNLGTALVSDTHGRPEHQGRRWWSRYPLVKAGLLFGRIISICRVSWFGNERQDLRSLQSPSLVPASRQLALPGTSLFDWYKNRGCHKLRFRLLSLAEWIVLLLFAKEP